MFSLFANVYKISTAAYNQKVLLKSKCAAEIFYALIKLNQMFYYQSLQAVCYLDFQQSRVSKRLKDVALTAILRKEHSSPAVACLPTFRISYLNFHWLR